jgi:hypothetical protein
MFLRATDFILESRKTLFEGFIIGPSKQLGAGTSGRGGKVRALADFAQSL